MLHRENKAWAGKSNAAKISTLTVPLLRQKPLCNITHKCLWVDRKGEKLGIVLLSSPSHAQLRAKSGRLPEAEVDKARTYGSCGCKMESKNAESQRAVRQWARSQSTKCITHSALVSALLIRAINFISQQCTDNLGTLPGVQHDSRESDCKCQRAQTWLYTRRSSCYSFVKIAFCSIYLRYTYWAKPHSKLVILSTKCNSIEQHNFKNKITAGLTYTYNFV